MKVKQQGAAEYRRMKNILIAGIKELDSVHKKVCSICGETKPLAEFYKVKRRRNYSESFDRSYDCRSCHSDRIAALRKHGDGMGIAKLHYDKGKKGKNGTK